MRPDWPRTLGLPVLTGAVAGAHHPHPQALTHLQLRESRGSRRSQGAGLCRDPILWGGAPHLGEPCPAGGLTPPPRGQTFSRLTGEGKGVLGRGNRRRGGRASAGSGQQRREPAEPRSERRTVLLLASLVPVPQLRARWLFTQTAGWAGSAISVALAPAPPAPGSLLLPPPLPSVRAPSLLPGMPQPAPSGLPVPRPVPATPASSRPERRGRAPGAGPWCPAPSAQEAPWLLPTRLL